MRFFSYYAALLIGILGLASCDASMPLCGTELSGTTDANQTASSFGCQSLVCTDQNLDCNNNSGDGCETNVSGDVNNCGSCGYKCATPSVGEATCIDGVCGVTTCGARYKDCNGNATDSCETDTFRDASNCGVCGTVCTAGANAVGCLLYTSC